MAALDWQAKRTRQQYNFKVHCAYSVSVNSYYKYVVNDMEITPA